MDIIFKRSPTTANTALVLEFPVKGTKFLVKNLTDGDVYVALTIFYKGIMPSEKVLDFPVDCNTLTGSVNL